MQIRCLALLKATRVWEFPGLDLKGAVPRGETIVLRVPADLRMKSWQAGGFRLAGNEITTEGGQTLTLTGINFSAGTARQRPRVEFQEASANYQVRQLAWWQIGPSSSSLYEQLVYQVTKGHLHELQLQVPPGWEVERAELTPVDLARTKTMTPKDGGTLLRIDLQRPLIAGPAFDLGIPIAARLSVTLRPVQTLPRDAAIPFPDLIPIGARFREGSLAINVDPHFQARVIGPRAEAPPEERGPWGKQPPDFYFSYRGQVLSGRLDLKPRHFQFKALASSEVTVVSDRASQVTRLALEPQEGKPQAMLVWFSAPLPKKFVWRTTAGRGGIQTSRRLTNGEFQSLLTCLAGPDSLLAATLLPWTPHGELWQLTLDRPLQGPLTVETTFDLPGRPAGKKFEIQNPKSEKNETGTSNLRFGASDFCYWDLPLPIVLQAEAAEGKVVAHTDPAGQIQLETIGLTPDEAQPADSKKTYHYGPGPATASLRGPGGKADRALPPALASQVRLDMSSDCQGRQVCRLRFELAGWPQKWLPIRLPPGTRPLGAVINDKGVSHLEWAEGNSSSEVQLPIPGGDRTQVELDYEMEAPSWVLWSEISLPVPELPLAKPPSFVRTVQLPAGVAPLNGRFRRLAIEDQASDNGVSSWEWQGETDLPIKVQLVRPGLLRKIGYGLGLALLMVGWRYWRVRWPWLLLGSACGAFLLLVLPGPLEGLALGPTYAVWALAAIALWGRLRTASWGKTQRNLAASAGITFICFLGATAVSAQVGPFRLVPNRPEPTLPVYLIPGTTEAMKSEMVLLSPEALEKLRYLADLPINSPLLLDSRYDGRVEESRAEFLAEWTVFSSSDKQARIIFPLSEVQLQEARLDGKQAEPIALPANEPGTSGPRSRRDRYAIDVQGRGFHTLRLRFGTSVQSAGNRRDIEFRIPELAQNRLTLTVPAGAHFLYAPAARGRQSLTPLANKENNKGLRLEADLGQVSSIHVRWQQAAVGSTKSAKEPPASLDVREAYLWDLRPAGSTLFAVLQYFVNQADVTGLEIALPDPLELRRDPTLRPSLVESIRAQLGGIPAPRLKEWRVTGAGKERRLHLEFQRPLAGQVHIILELVPRKPLGLLAELPLPSPFGDKAARRSVADAPSFLAFRTEDLQAQIASHLRITGIDANDFRDYWVAVGLPDPGPETHALSFQRNPGNPPVLRLQLQAPPLSPTERSAGPTAWQDIRWLVKPGQADFTAKTHLTASSRDLALIEFDLPWAVNLIDVTGPEVYAWSQIPRAGGASRRPAADKSRLQVWLKGMFAETNLELTGWMKLEEAAVNRPVSAPGAPPEVTRSNDRHLFPLPPIQLLSAADQRILIRVESQAGWDLELVGRKNLWPTPNSAPPRALLSPTGESGSLEEYLTDHSDYEGTFQLSRTAGSNSTNSAKPHAKE
jgi:hypothetical protein